MCRQELPSNRKGASELLLHFSGRLDSQNKAEYHRLVYGGTQDSPWIYFPPPTDRLEDLNIDMVTSPPDKFNRNTLSFIMEKSENSSIYRTLCETCCEMINDVNGDGDSSPRKIKIKTVVLI